MEGDRGLGQGSGVTGGNSGRGDWKEGNKETNWYRWGCGLQEIKSDDEAAGIPFISWLTGESNQASSWDGSLRKPINCILFQS